MDKINVLLVVFVLNLIFHGVISDPQCDCNALVDEQNFIKLEIMQIKSDNFKINSRLRRLDASRQNGKITAGVHNSQSTNNDRKEETRLEVRIESLETKLTDIEALLKISDISGTSVQQAVLQSDVLDQIETRLSTVSELIKDFIRNNDAGNFVRKTLLAEKRRRINLESDLKSSMEDVKTSFHEFKTESENLIHNHSDIFNRKLERSDVAINEITVNIKKNIHEELQKINMTLYNSMKQLSNTSTELSNLLDVTLNDIRDGQWSSWENWGSCSEACGGGIQNRLRTCSSPRPSYLGSFCEGSPLQIRTCNKQHCKEFDVAFTAYDLESKSTSLNLVFQSTYLNNGNAYDTSTGKFTCKIPGLYYFSASLTKYTFSKEERILSLSYLYINDISKIAVGWTYFDDVESFNPVAPFAQSGTFHLDKNDIVYIGGSGSDFFGLQFSTFTGHLITPD